MTNRACLHWPPHLRTQGDLAAEITWYRRQGDQVQPLTISHLYTTDGLLRAHVPMEGGYAAMGDRDLDPVVILWSEARVPVEEARPTGEVLSPVQQLEVQ